MTDKVVQRRCAKVKDLKAFLDELPDDAQVAICNEFENQEGSIHRQWWGISEITYMIGEGVRIR